MSEREVEIGRAESLSVYGSLELDVGDNLRLYFGAKNGNLSVDADVALYDRDDHAYKKELGTISYLEDELHESWIDVTGRALATRKGAAH